MATAQEFQRGRLALRGTAPGLEAGVPPERILEALHPLLELPVELVLPTHGAPTDRAALERALS
jgi:hypothetical protein